MPMVNINGREYDADTMSDEAKSQLTMLQLVDLEIRRLDAQLAIHKTARNTYVRALVEAFPILGMTEDNSFDFK